MKKVLLASTALIFVGGMAMAEVSVGGDGRMGIIDDFGDDTDVTFNSRIRISFSASGETDGGLSFGGSIRADNAGDGASGAAGSVFAEGAFGKISMGDVDGAANAAVGHVSGVGYTGLSDVNEIFYVANVGPDLPGVLYEYSTGDLSFYASADRPNVGTDADAYAVGVSYGFGNYTVALGYEDTEAATIEFADVEYATDAEVTHLVAGATAAFGDATVKFVYGDGEANDSIDITQYAVSLDYVFGATTATGFYRMSELGDVEITAWGIGAAYDLGGGASLVGGWANIEADDGVDTIDGDAFDFGLKMSF